MTGKTIGKYRIVEKLGRGGMGTVYKAIDETLEREVAVKVLNPGLSEDGVMKRFQAEATTLARLNHPDIATIHEIYQADGDLLMVMEFVRGETLDELVQRSGALPPERAAYLVAQILGALDHAHRAGVIHRDLKPANVMVTEYGGVKIMDFGIAHVAGAEHITAAGFMLGTPAYMAPERVLGRAVDARSDLYSAGVIFYRLLTAALPFKADTPAEMAERVLSETPTPARVHRPDVPGWCQAILDRALARSPDERFPNAEVFRATLVGAISSIGSEETGLFPTPDLAHHEAFDVTMAAQVAGTNTQRAAIAVTPPPRGTASAPAAMSAPRAAPPVATANAPAPAVTGTGAVVLEKKQFAIAGGLLALLFVAVVALAILVLRRPATTTIVQAPPPVAQPAPAPASTPAAVTPVTETAAVPPSPTGAPSATPTASAPASANKPASPTTAPAATPPSGRGPTEISESAIRTAPPAAAPPPAMATTADGGRGVTPVATMRSVPVMPLYQFDGKVVVIDGDKRRERDAIFRLADGVLTVIQKPNTTLYSVPLNTVTTLTYSNSRQPLWNSPTGPAEAMKVETGAFGFMRGGGHWFGVRTADSLMVLRVEDTAVSRVLTALRERVGLPVQRLVEPKD